MERAIFEEMFVAQLECAMEITSFFISRGTTAQIADTLHKELHGAVSITFEPNGLNRSIKFF